MADARGHQDRSEPGLVLDELLLHSWEIAMRAERKAPRTIHLYLTQARAFIAWCGGMDSPARFDRHSIQAFLSAESERLAANSLLTRYKGLRQLAVWLHDEGETATMVMEGMTQPKVEDQPVPLLPEEQLRTLLRACEGTTYADRRDMAVTRLLLDSGARAGEIVDLNLEDVDLKGGTIHLIGKGGRSRTVPFGANTARALDRYLRARRSHRFASSSRLWLGQRGPMTYDGIAQALRVRARSARVEGFHPHALRHLLAHRWLSAGGSELGLQDIAGWRSGEMIRRYAASARGERAQAEHRRLGLGEDL